MYRLEAPQLLNERLHFSNASQIDFPCVLWATSFGRDRS
jgi:hypothetical protein